MSQVNEKYEVTENGVLRPRGSMNMPNLIKGKRLKADQDKVDKNVSAFMTVVWFFLAATTFFFGFQNLPTIFKPMLSWLPFTASTIHTVSQWLGGIMGLVFLDGGYKMWGYVRLNASETSNQVKASTVAEMIAFVGSVYFTIAVIASAFVDTLPSSLIWLLQVGGVFVFIGSSVATMVCSFLFLRWSTQSMELAQAVENEGKQTTEILSIHARVRENALKKLAQRMEGKEDELSNSLADVMTGNLHSGMLSEIHSDTAAQIDIKSTGKK